MHGKTRKNQDIRPKPKSKTKSKSKTMKQEKKQTKMKMNFKTYFPSEKEKQNIQNINQLPIGFLMHLLLILGAFWPPFWLHVVV